MLLQNLDRRPGPSSCRAGGVVHLLAANGTKLPVTLKMSIKEGSEATGLLHIIHVSRAHCPVSHRDHLVVTVVQKFSRQVPTHSPLSWSWCQLFRQRLLSFLQVEKATDDELLNQRCLLLSVNHQGTILDVNTGGHSNWVSDT